MLLFAEDDLVSTSLIHAAVVQSSDIFNWLCKAPWGRANKVCMYVCIRQDENAFDKKNDKQTAERPIRHIDSYPSGGLDRNSVDMSELYSKISFSAVHTNI